MSISLSSYQCVFVRVTSAIDFCNKSFMSANCIYDPQKNLTQHYIYGTGDLSPCKVGTMSYLSSNPSFGTYSLGLASSSLSSWTPFLLGNVGFKEKTHSFAFSFSSGNFVCVCVLASQSCSTLCNTRLLCPQNSPGKNTGVGCHSLLQGVFLTQVSRIGGRFFTIWANKEAP